MTPLFNSQMTNLCWNLAFILLLFLNLNLILCDLSENGLDEGYYQFLYNSMKKDQEIRRAEHHHAHHHKHSGKIESKPVNLPGDYEPLPGRSSNGDYWPLYPLSNQYHASLTFDPSYAKHYGGDMAIPVPYWGFIDMSGHFIERVQDFWTKIGYVNSPINMLGLRKDQIARLVSDPSLNYNRANQPNLPMAKIPKNNVPLSCRPPMCNPYHANMGFGVEVNKALEDGVEGELDLPIPIGKDIGYRLPISGNFHCDPDDLVISYGQNLSPIDPFTFARDKKKRRKRRKRSTEEGESVSHGETAEGEETIGELETEDLEAESEEVEEEEESGGEGNERVFMICRNPTT